MNMDWLEKVEPTLSSFNAIQKNIIIIIATNYSTGAKMDLKQQYILVLAPLTN